MRLLALLCALSVVFLARAGAALAEEPFPVTTRDLRIAAEVDFPPDTAVIVQTGCTNCHGGFGDLYRVYRLGYGPVRSEPVLLGSGPRDWRMVTSFVSTPGATVMFFGACVGPCDLWSLPGTPLEDQPNETRFYRSHDGGVTWNAVHQLPGYVIGQGVLDGDVVYSKLAHGPNPTLDLEWALWSSDGRRLTQDEASRVVQVRGSLIARTAAGLTTQTSLPQQVTPPVGTRVFPFAVPRRNSLPLIAWSSKSPGATVSYLSDVGFRTALISSVQYNLQGAFDERFILVSLMLPDPTPTDPERPFPSRRGYAPALLDFDGATAYPIGAPFGQVSYEDHGTPFSGRNVIEAVWRGPFLRVATSECLPLRAWADAFASVTACAAPGVLLRPAGGVRYEKGVEWRKASLPNGTTGWVPRTSVEG